MDSRQFGSISNGMEYQHTQGQQQNQQQRLSQQHHIQQQSNQMNQTHQHLNFVNQNSAAALNAARMKQSRYFNESPNSQLNPSGSGSNWNQTGNNLGPWIEQQQQQQQHHAGPEHSGQNYSNSFYVHQSQNMLSVPMPLQPNITGNSTVSQSMQTNYDSNSMKYPSPSESNLSIMRNNGAPDLPLNEMHNDSHELKNNNTSDIHNINENKSYNDTNYDCANDDLDDDEDHENDDLIPTAIVIKNIPFAIKKEQLLEVMTKLNLPLPYAFNYHFDNGVFRGLAFANFTNTDETTAVVTHLNGREIGGRKLRVEYKKMLPLAERERIEREKREKRGQLEEQHRSTSTASLASMVSVASAPAAGLNKMPPAPLTSNGNNNPANIQQLLSNVSPVNQNTNSISNVNPPSVNERFYAPIPVYNNLISPPNAIDLNDAETLEYYNQMIFFRDDKEKIYNEIAYPQTLNNNHRKIISVLAHFIGLVEVLEGNLILLRRRSNSPTESVMMQQSTSMSNMSTNSNTNDQLMLNNVNSALLRSHSQSSLPVLNGSSTTIHHSNRFRPTGSNQIPQHQHIQQQLPQHHHHHQQPIPQSPVIPSSSQHNSSTASRIPPSFQMGGLNLNNSMLMRNNPTPTARSISGMYQQNFYQPSSNASSGIPGVLSANLTGGSLSNGLNSNVENELNDSLNGLNLSMDNSAISGNIWGKGN